VDTISWKEKNDLPPITDDAPFSMMDLPESELKEVYNVDILIPFKSSGFRGEEASYSELSEFQTRFANYYAGLRLAAHDLSEEGVNLNIRIHDTKYSAEAVRKMYFNGDFRKSDVIIGPYKRESVKWLGDKIKYNETTMISPWISSATITNENPHFVQMKPGLLKHYEVLLERIIRDHEGQDVYLVTKGEDESKVRLISRVAQSLDLDLEVPVYEVLELSPDSLSNGEMAFDTSLFSKKHCKKVFLVPYASGRDASFVYNFLRKLQIEKLDCEVTVYGMYKWLDYQEEIFELMNTMPVKVSISNLMNPADERIRSFMLRFFDIYGAYPTIDGAEGYDVMYYIGKSLNKGGNRFHFYDMMNPYIGLQTSYDIHPVFEEGDQKPQYYENSFIDIISIKDYQYHNEE
jgi:hypothetical protein